MTGGGSGIGEATARMLALHGCAVAIADINPAAARRVAEEVEQAGNVALAVAMDVTKAEQVLTAVGRAADRPDHPDIIVSNAGIVLAGNLIDIDMKDWQLSFRG